MQVIVREASELQLPPCTWPMTLTVEGQTYQRSHISRTNDLDNEIEYVEYRTVTSQHPSILRVFND